MDMGGDFEAMAKVALGTDDPERIAALREAMMACMGAEEKGEYGPEPAGDTDLASVFGKK